jgi:hypothetical protein
MKKNFTKLSLAIMVLTVLLNSCSKVADNYDYKKMATSIELPIAAHAGPASFENGGFKYNISQFISSTPQPLATTVLVSAVKPLTSAVTVTMAVDNSVVTQLNALHRSLYIADSTSAVANAGSLPDPSESKYDTYVPLPAADFTIPSNTVNIPAGQLTASYVINVTTANLVLGTKYMLPVAIKDAQGQPINYYKAVYYIINVASKYQGDYTANGSIAFPNPASDRTWSARAKSLTTIDGNTVRCEAADLGGSNYFMNLKVNSDNTVTVTSAAGAANQTIQNNGVCVYDPATKTFTLNYKYVGGTGDRRIAETIALN